MTARLTATLAGATGLALVLSCSSSFAAARRETPVPGPGSQADMAEAQALGLLTVAVRAARGRSYRGMQYVTTWRGGVESQRLYSVRYTPATGMLVADAGSPVALGASGNPGSAVPVTNSALDERLLGLLAQNYVLSVGNVVPYEGRLASVVEARRAGSGDLAGCFWVDRATGLVLRREVYDTDGRLVRSSGFASLTVQPAGAAAPVLTPTPPMVPVASYTELSAAGDRVDEPGLLALQGEGWPIRSSLPGNLDLFDARLRTSSGAPVLQLAYSDGLSTMSLFVQPGRLGTSGMPGFSNHLWGSHPVWVQTGSPMRVVWSGGGRVWTLVSDSAPEAVTAAVATLPHDQALHPGLLARIRSGIARLAGWLNPFG